MTITPQPDASGTVTPTTCHSQLPGVRLCLDFESSFLPTDSSGIPHQISIQNVNRMPRGTQEAALLDASSSISIGDSPDLDIPGPLSIEMWIDPTGYTQNDAYLVSNGAQYGFFVEGGQLMCGLSGPGPNGAQALVSSPSSIPMNVWTHVACVFDGVSLKLYVGGNGASCAQQTMTIDTQQRQGLQLGVAMTGGLDDVHIYGANLRDEDVCRLATGGTGCAAAPCGTHGK